MKKIINTIRWIGVTLFGIMSVFAFSEGGFLGGLLFLLGGIIIAPLNFVKGLRSKLKLNKAFSIVIAVILLFAGALATPTSEIPTDDGNTLQSQIISSVSSEEEKNITTSKEDVLESVSKTEETVSKEEISSETKTSSKEETVSKPTVSAVGSGKAQPVKLSEIPKFSGKAYAVINDNTPNFSIAELKTTGYETYSSLDSLGRTRVAIASVGKDTMPKSNEKRGSISKIKPSGWKQAKYDSISGGWLYNRCHLIGWQLSAENANKGNLITGTKYLNVSGMLPFENMVADYIDETENHVAYRITPIYEGNNLLASGVQMEAYSVEDNGEGICFNVYCYNVEPNITIDYATGNSSDPNATDSSDKKTTDKNLKDNAS